MARAIRYASSAAAAEHGPTATSVRGETKDLDVDGYLERLAKYVPGEILAGFTPLAVLAKDRPVLLTSLSIIFLLLTPAYLYITKEVQAPDSKTKVRPYLYILAPIAFVVWALNTSEAFRALVAQWPPVHQLGTLDATVASVVLALGALIIPAIDIILDYRLAQRGR
ncbi:MAG TPA: hypothetical protein VFW02_07165 [Candidatus Limnocylindrales bacterium]|nr:hypothetical protein [Candidatus Limnocylindrales bacterium]